MPRRSDKPKAAVEVNPQFVNRPGVEVVEALPEPIRTPTDALQRPQVAASYDDLAKALAELGELLRNGQQMTAQGMASVLRDAHRRVALIRAQLGL